MRVLSPRRAVRSAALLESVELRRLLSVAPDAGFGTGGVVTFDDALPLSSQYDQIVSASTGSSITTVAEISDLNTDLENQLIVRRFGSTGASISTNTITLPFAAGDALKVTDLALDAGSNAYVAGSRFDPGTSTNVGFVVKITTGGLLDGTFGGDGSIDTPELSFNSQSVRLAVSGGQIFAGYVTGNTSVHTVNVLAFDTSGSPSLSYGTSGLTSAAVPQDGATLSKLLVDGSGLLAVGATFVSDNDGNTPDPEMVYAGRFDGTGALDAGYGTAGFAVSTAIGYSDVVLNGVTRVTGGLVVAGTDPFGVQVLAKLDSNMNLDPSFDGDGVLELAPSTIVLSPLDLSTRTLSSDSAGNVYATGIATGDDSADLGVIRLTATGALDAGFDGDGVFTYDNAEADVGIGLTATPSGALLVTGLQIDGNTGLQNGLLVQLAEPAPANTAPVVSAVNTAGSVNTGVSTGFSSSFSDADAADTFTVAWNFGDGNTTAPVVTAQGAVSASHIYTVAGTYTVTVSISDGVNPAQISSTTIVVTTPPPPVPYTVVSGQLGLTGGTGADTVELVKSGASYVLTVNGTPYTITNTLSSVVISGGSGADFIRVSSQITLPVSLIGGQGNDTLRGGSGDDVIVGDEGNDLIIGRDGQDLMIGGTGADFLIGREDADLLISGTTSLSSNLAALSAIMAEWTSSHALLVKLANVTGLLPLPGRLNGNFYLTPEVTVFGDSNVDTLSGGDGSDLYYVSLFGLNSDVIRDNQSSFAANIATLVFGD